MERVRHQLYDVQKLSWDFIWSLNDYESFIRVIILQKEDIQLFYFITCWYRYFFQNPKISHLYINQWRYEFYIENITSSLENIFIWIFYIYTNKKCCSALSEKLIGKKYSWRKPLVYPTRSNLIPLKSIKN